jgi:hypothetical protein
MVRRICGIRLARSPSVRGSHAIDLVASDVARRRRCLDLPHCQYRLPSCAATNPGIDMPKPSLRLIHCSNGIRRGAKRRQNSSDFQPFVIPGGLQSMPGERAWEAALELIGLGLSISYANYLALLQASTIVLAGSNWIDHEKTS